MILTERHLITTKHKYFKEIDELSFKSKNLYNQANYRIRQAFTNKENPKYRNFNEIQREMQDEKQIDYISLPAKVSQQILMKLDKNWKSFFVTIKDYKNNPQKYFGRPKLPKYKDIKNGRNLLTYTIQAISKKELKKGFINFSKTNIKIKTKVDITKIKEVRIVPRIKSYYKKSELQSQLPKNQFNSNKITKLTNKRNNKIDNYLHKISKFIIFCCCNCT